MTFFEGAVSLVAAAFLAAASLRCLAAVSKATPGRVGTVMRSAS